MARALRVTKITPGKIVKGRFVANPCATQALDRRIDRLLRQIYGMQDEFQREMLKDKHSAKYKRMSKTYMKRLRAVDALQKQYRAEHGMSENHRNAKSLHSKKAGGRGTSIRELKKSLRAAGYSPLIVKQVVKTAKGYARSRKLVRAGR